MLKDHGINFILSFKIKSWKESGQSGNREEQVFAVSPVPVPTAALHAVTSSGQMVAAQISDAGSSGPAPAASHVVIQEARAALHPAIVVTVPNMPTVPLQIS